MESSLVVIPLLSLFLITTQISIVIHGRNMEKMHAQDIASSEAINGEFSGDDSFIHIDSPDPNQNLDLLITRRRNSVVGVFPGLSAAVGHEPITDVTGFAVIENQR